MSASKAIRAGALAIAASVAAYNVGVHVGSSEADTEWEEYLGYDDEKECWCVEDITACSTS